MIKVQSQKDLVIQFVKMVHDVPYTVQNFSNFKSAVEKKKSLEVSRIKLVSLSHEMVEVFEELKLAANDDAEKAKVHELIEIVSRIFNELNNLTKEVKNV